MAMFVAHDIHEAFSSRGIYNEIECKSGCDYCCYQIVTISIFEAVFLAESLIDIEDAEVIRLQNISNKNVKINNTIKVDSERWKSLSPCPLLINKKCSQYSYRPLVCEISNSISSEVCKNQFNSRSLRGHEVIHLSLPDYNVDNINIQMKKYAEQAGISLPLKLSMHAFQIDLDKLIKYIAVNPKERRQQRLRKLENYDSKTIKALKKRSMNVKEYESIYNVTI